MNLLILNWRDIKHPLAGGAEVCIFEHAKYWQKKGINVTWFTSSFKGAKTEETIDGIKIVRRGSQFTVHLLFLKSYILNHHYRDFDIVVDCFHFIPFFTPFYLGKRKNIAFIHEVAGKLWFKNLFFPVALLGYLLEPLFFLLYRNVPFITVSESTREELMRLRINKQNITLIHNGVTVPKLEGDSKKEKEPTVIFLGRISQDKGISDALRAFQEVRRTMKEVRLWIVGKEERVGYLKSLLTSYDISPDSVKYFGYVSEKEKFQLLRKAWILLHPSEKEGWGITVIEAASQGTPTVGYDVEGLRDSIRDNKTGILTQREPHALSSAVVEVLGDKVRYNALSEEAQKWAKEFDWEKSSKKSYELLLRKKKAI